MTARWSLGNHAEVMVWDLAAGTEAQFACPGGAIATAAPLVSPDGRWVAVHASGDRGHKLVVREVSSGTHAVVAEVATDAPSSTSRDPAFSPDGRWLVVPSGPRELALFSAASWHRKLTLTSTTRDQPELVFAPDGRRVFELHSGVKGQTLKVLDAESGQEVLAFPCSARHRCGRLCRFISTATGRSCPSMDPRRDDGAETFDGTPVAEEVRGEVRSPMILFGSVHRHQLAAWVAAGMNCLAHSASAGESSGSGLVR